MRVLKEEAAQQGRRVTLAVAGCVAQAEGAEIMRRAPVVDLVVGPQSYHRLPDLLAREQRQETGIIETEFPVQDKFAFLPAPSIAKTKSRGVTAFVTAHPNVGSGLSAGALDEAGGTAPTTWIRVGVMLPSDANNTFQGRSASLGLNWHITQ